MVSAAAFALSLVEPCSAQSVQAANTTHVGTSGHHNHHVHSSTYSAPSVAYYPYSVPYGYNIGRRAYRRAYVNYGYPVNLNGGLQRGFLYGNTYINPNFGN